MAHKLLAYVPAPNANQGASGVLKYQNNLNTSSLFTQNTPFIDTKIDRFFRNNDHISGRFSFEKPTLNQAGLFGVAGDPFPAAVSEARRAMATKRSTPQE